MSRMNAEMCALVAENIRLAEWCALEWCNSHQYATEFDVDDWRSIAHYGLCKAAVTYRIETGNKFSTWAVTCIKNELGLALRKARCKSRYNPSTCSLDAYCDEFSESLVNAVPDPDPATDPAFTCISKAVSAACLEALNIASDLYAGSVSDFLLWADGGVRQVDLADRDGITQKAVSKRFSRIRRAAEEELKRRGWAY